MRKKVSELKIGDIFKTQLTGNNNLKVTNVMYGYNDLFHIYFTTDSENISKVQALTLRGADIFSVMNI